MFEDSNTSGIVQLQRDIQQLLASQLRQQELASKNESDHTSLVKLPKTEMISFDGDKTKWFKFWDSFKCAIHNNTRISNVEKFNYLKGKLCGEEQSALSGLSLTNENYKVAIDILSKHFGNTLEIIDIHYNQLVNLQPALSKAGSLRDFLDKVDRHLHSLEELQQNVNQEVFVSIIRSKLPEDVLF